MQSQTKHFVSAIVVGMSLPMFTGVSGLAVADESTDSPVARIMGVFTNPKLFSEWTRALPRAERERILARYWRPHRDAVELHLEEDLSRNGRSRHEGVPVPDALDHALDVGPQPQRVVRTQPEQIVEGHFLAEKAHAARRQPIRGQHVDQRGPPPARIRSPSIIAASRTMKIGRRRRWGKTRPSVGSTKPSGTACFFSPGGALNCLRGGGSWGWG